MISQPNAARNQQTEQALRAQASDIANQIRELDRSIAAQFPDYTGLVTKTSVSIDEVQRRLNPNEALLLFATTLRFTFVWTVTRANVRWHAASIGTKQLAETINILRCGLDAEAWMETAHACAEKLGRDRAPAAGDQLPFDLDRAFGLYQALLEPVAKDIEGKELILVPSGPLATLPFQVLLTEKPAPAAGRQDLAKAPWLVKRFATTVLPSVSSLKALRQVAQRSKAPKPFIGFGNPLLGGNAQSAFDADRAAQARLRQSCGPGCPFRRHGRHRATQAPRAVARNRYRTMPGGEQFCAQQGRRVSRQGGERSYDKIAQRKRPSGTIPYAPLCDPWGAFGPGARLDRARTGLDTTGCRHACR